MRLRRCGPARGQGLGGDKQWHDQVIMAVARRAGKHAGRRQGWPEGGQGRALGSCSKGEQVLPKVRGVRWLIGA